MKFLLDIIYDFEVILKIFIRAFKTEKTEIRFDESLHMGYQPNNGSPHFVAFYDVKQFSNDFGMQNCNVHLCPNAKQ